MKYVVDLFSLEEEIEDLVRDFGFWVSSSELFLY